MYVEVKGQLVGLLYQVSSSVELRSSGWHQSAFYRAAHGLDSSFLLFFLCVQIFCLFMSVYDTCFWFLRRPKDNVRSSGTTATDSYNLPRGCRGQTLEALSKKQPSDLKLWAIYPAQSAVFSKCLHSFLWLEISMRWFTDVLSCVIWTCWLLLCQ